MQGSNSNQTPLESISSNIGRSGGAGNRIISGNTSLIHINTSSSLLLLPSS